MPLLDAFGTRISKEETVSGLEGLGLGTFSLLVKDDSLVLRLPAKGVPPEVRDSAVVWLKGLFSPLMACRVEALEVCSGVREVIIGLEKPVLTAALVEVFKPGDLQAAFPALLSRLNMVPSGPRPEPGCFVTLAQWRAGMRWRSPAAKGPLFLSWQRKGGAKGIRPAWILAAAMVPEALDWLAQALDGRPPGEGAFRVLLDGLEWGVARRPTIAALAGAGFALPVAVDEGRCAKCGLCSRVCPMDCLAEGGRFKSREKVKACLRCFDCVEACPQDALRPVYGHSSAMLSERLLHRSSWLSRLAGMPGPASPRPFPPSFLLPKPGKERKPRLVLGLALTTLQEHAAALIKEGKVVSAVEEERFSRSRHHGWHAPGRPGVSIVMDPTLCPEEAFPRESISSLLAPGRLSMDDMDIIAINGIPARYRRAFSAVESGQPIPTLRAGRVVYVPHHLSHAASAYRVSGMDDAWILTVDGRGDRETAAVFRGKGGKIAQVMEVLALTDRSIGGVYETVTHLLGFGPHGQGSVMALASFGRPGNGMRPFLSWKGPKDHSIHEIGISERFKTLARQEHDPLTTRHQDLAASLQDSLEKTIIGILRSAGVKPGVEGLCLAGGVALNCRMNQVLREVFKPKRMFVQPGANDAGTALGAGLEALSFVGAMEHALLGPSFSRAEMLASLKSAGVSFKLLKDAPAEAGRRLAQGLVVCWFDGCLEFGPRALGSRSILADPRNAGIKDRVNRIKGREHWRPFGPAILSGHEKEWFVDGFDSRFMLFTLPLKKDKASKVPAVAHVDGTSRPQVVHREHQPRFHELIRKFHGLTGVPMALNTSFNRRGEPIVCSPEDALTCFKAMAAKPGGPDCLFLGDFLVEARPLPVTGH